MWFKLNTTFTQSLGTLDSLSNSWSITRNLTNFSTTSTTTSVTKNGSYKATFTLNRGCTYSSHSVTMGGATVTSGVSYSNGTLTVNISKVTGAVVITAVATGASSGGTTTNYTFTLNPTPTSATVTLSATGYSTVSGTGSKSITVANGTKVNWSVSASGYTIRTGSWTISGGNKTENITLTATSGGGGSALDLSTLSLAHCGSSKLATGNKENLTYDQTTHELKVNNPGWYKVSYFTTPVQVGTEIEYIANYSTSNIGNFVGIYKQEDLVDGIAEANGSYWPAPSGFGVYAPGQGGNDFIYIWDRKNAKTKTADGLEGDYFNKKTIKLKLLATGTEVYVDGVKLTWASGAAAATLTEGVNYYLGFHNNNSTGTSASTVASQTITYIGPIR